jgi:U3 small nucleolar RNA-associated protein 19
MSLLKHLSSTLSTSADPTSSSSKPTPQFHASHFKKIVSALILCPPSSRSTTHSSKKARRATEEDEAEDADTDSEGKLDPDVRQLFLDTWLTVHDDIRWFFLREAACVLFRSIQPSHSPSSLHSTILQTHPTSAHPHLPENIISLLEKLDTFPTDAAELNAWWVPELGTTPPKPKSSKSAASADSDDEDAHAVEPDAADDDWRKYFDEPDDKDKEAAGAAKKGKKKGAAGARLHTLNVHQSLHALASHRAVFTRCWLALLPRLAESEDESRALSVRALNIMHRGVLPHLTRAVMAMDWVGSCVDYGGTPGLLALNALFVLMTEYNL